MASSRPGSILPSRAGSIVHDDTTGQLVKRNREIAEVRDELDKMQKRLSNSQARNKVLLEENSELDSEVARQSARCAASEQRIAGLEDEARSRDEEHKEQEARHAETANIAKQRRDDKIQQLRHAEDEVSEQMRLANAVAAELAEHRALLEAEEKVVSDVQKSREEYSRPRDVGPSSAARLAAETQREALNSRLVAETAEETASRQRVSTLEVELESESKNRQALDMATEKVVSEQGGHDARLKHLEQTLIEHGGNVAAVLSEHQEEIDLPGRRGSVSSLASFRSDTGAALASELRQEVEKAQARKNALHLNAKSLRENAEQDSVSLQSQLDDARNQLQKNIHEAANKQAAEASKLEDEVQKERQKRVLEELAEQQCAARIKELQQTKIDIAFRGQMAAESRRQHELAEAARCQILSDELASKLREKMNAEARLQDVSHRAVEANARRVKLQTEGEQRLKKTRNMIEELWSEARKQSLQVAMRP